MRLQRLEINPEILEWARERSGYDIESAAAKLDIPVSTLQAIESGASYPTAAQLRRAFATYRLSPAVAFLDAVPASGFDAPRDFRSLPESSAKTFPPELRAEVDRVRGQVRFMHELEELGVARSLFRNPELQTEWLGVESFASEIRHWLGMPTADLTAATGDSRLTLAAWVAAIERKGILVSQVSGIPLETMRGFCIADSRFPMIVLNGADSYAPRLFTLLHELVHLLQGDEAVCGSPVSDDRVEQVCNSVAAATLIPREALLQFDVVGRAGPKTRWTLDDLSPLAAQFGVSREAVLRRLLTLNKTSDDCYRRLRSQLIALYASSSKKKRSGGPDREVLLLRNLGRTYVSTVLEARERGLLSDSMTADYLFAKVRWADPLAALLSVNS